MNETAGQTMGWISAVGKTIREGALDGIPLTVAGVVKDFHLESLHRKIQPTIIACERIIQPGSSLLFDGLHGMQTGASIQALQNQWKILFPDAGFNYFFMDEKFLEIYLSEMPQG